MSFSAKWNLACVGSRRALATQMRWRVTEIALPSLKKPKQNKLLDQFGNPYSDSYCTPRKITDRLPARDLDPCSNPRSTVRAKRAYSLERKLDGLKLSWPGEVFVNWPYSDPLPWAV